MLCAWLVAAILWITPAGGATQQLGGSTQRSGGVPQQSDGMLPLATTRRAATIEVTTLAALKSAVDTVGNIVVLGSDITVSTSYVHMTKNDVTIEGNDKTIDGGGNTQCFFLDGTMNIFMKYMTISDCYYGSYGGAFTINGNVGLFFIGVTLTSSNIAGLGGDAIYATGTVNVNFIGSFNSGSIYITASTCEVFSYSACGVDRYFAGTGTSTCTGYSSCSWITDTIGSCLACPPGQYSCCGAASCSSTAPTCTTKQESICDYIAPDPTPAPTLNPTTPPPSLSPSLAPTQVPTSPTNTPTLSPTSFCPMGSYINPDSDQCELCPIGTFSDTPNAPFPTTCAECEAGRYSIDAGASACKECAAGKLSSADRTFCKDCNAGEYAYLGLSCEKCTRGRFAPTPQANDCFLCAAGSHTNNATAATTCTACNAGQFSLGGVVECEACVAGTWSTSGQTSCFFCQKGFYSAAAGTPTCAACEAGTFSAAEGAISCQDCPAGKAGTKTGQYACESCSVAKFAENTGMTSCEPCPEGYSSLEGSSDCLICNSNYFDGDPDASGAVCKPCFLGIDCGAPGANVATLTLKTGYWRVGAASEIVLLCPEPRYCTGGSDPDKYCKSGHVGPYCAECDKDGFYKWDGECYRCSGESWVPVAFGTVVFFSAVVCAVAIWHTGRVQKELKKLSHDSAMHIKNVAKTTFVTLQILVLFPVVLDIQFPSPFSELLGYVSIVTVNLKALTTGLECFFPTAANYYWYLVFATMSPVLICAAMLAFGCIFPASRSRCSFWVVFVLFVMLPASSVAAFRVFPCEEFDDGSIWLRAVSEAASSFYHSIFCRLHLIFNSGSTAWFISGLHLGL